MLKAGLSGTLPACQTTHQKHLRARRNCLRPVIAKDHPVYRHSNFGLEGPSQPRIPLCQLAQQFADGLGVNFNRLLTIRQWHKATPQGDFYHYPFAAFSAAKMRGGDTGTWAMRTPTALDTAFAIAAKGGTIEVSPTPRTP